MFRDLVDIARVRSPLFPCNPQHQTLATKCNVNELIYYPFPYLFRLFVPFHVKALQRVFFTQEEYTAMLRLYNGRGMEEPPLVEEVACEWMKLNQDVWSQWKPFDLTAKTELYIGGIFPISGPFYKSGRGMVPGSRQSLTNRFALCVTSPYGQYSLSLDYISQRGFTLYSCVLGLSGIWNPRIPKLPINPKTWLKLCFSHYLPFSGSRIIETANNEG